MEIKKENVISIENNDFSKKSKRPLGFKKSLVFFGCLNVFKSPKKIISLILASLCFAAWCTDCVFSRTDVLKTQLHAAYACDSKVVLVQAFYHSTRTDDNKITFKGLRNLEIPLRLEQSQKLKNDGCLFSIHESSDYFDETFDGRGYLASVPKESIVFPDSGFYDKDTANLVARAIEVSPEKFSSILEKDDRVHGENRLPIDYIEIAITDYLADLFIQYGFKDKDGSGDAVKINSPEQLIGKSFCQLTICGVFKAPKEDLAFLGNVKRTVFLRDGFKENSGGDSYHLTSLFVLSGDEKFDYAILRNLDHVDVSPFRVPNADYLSYYTYYYSANVKSNFSDKLTRVSLCLDGIFLYFFKIVCVFLAIIGLIFIKLAIKDKDDESFRKKLLFNKITGEHVKFLPYRLIVLTVFIASFITSFATSWLTCLLLNLLVGCFIFSVDVVSTIFLVIVCLTISVVAVLFYGLSERRRYHKRARAI